MTDFSSMSDEELLKRRREIREALNKEFKRPNTSISELSESPTSGMSPFNLGMAGAGKWATDIGRGSVQRLSQATNILAKTGNPLAIAAQLSGLGAQEKRLSEQERETRKLDQPLMQTAPGKLGYMAAPIALGMTAGGPLLAPKTFGQAALAGPAYGLLQPSIDNLDMLRNVGLSTAGSLAGQVPGWFAQHLARPMMPSAQAKALLSEDVVPTPGQAADPAKLSGRMIRNFEERASSAPIIGEPIHAARERAIGELNKAALARTGDTTGQIGIEAVGNRAQEIGQQLDDIISKIGNVQVSPQDVSKITSVSSGRLMEPAHESMLARQMQLLKDGKMTGTDLAKLRTQWRSTASQYSKSGNPSQRELGSAMRDAVTNLDDFIEKSAPAGVNQAYKALRSQYRNLIPVENAAASAANRPNQPGVFTPQQFFQGVKTAAEGMKRKAITQNRAPQQDLATAGMILRNTRPESGTTERAITAGLLGGGLLGTGYAGQEGYDWRIPATIGILSAGMYGARPATQYLSGGYGWQEPVAAAIQNLIRPAGSIAGAQYPALRKKQR